MTPEDRDYAFELWMSGEWNYKELCERFNSSYTNMHKLIDKRFRDYLKKNHSAYERELEEVKPFRSFSDEPSKFPGNDEFLNLTVNDDILSFTEKYNLLIDEGYIDRSLQM